MSFESIKFLNNEKILENKHKRKLKFLSILRNPNPKFEDIFVREIYVSDSTNIDIGAKYLQEHQKKDKKCWSRLYNLNKPIFDMIKEESKELMIKDCEQALYCFYESIK